MASSNRRSTRKQPSKSTTTTTSSKKTDGRTGRRDVFEFSSDDDDDDDDNSLLNSRYGGRPSRQKRRRGQNPTASHRNNGDGASRMGDERGKTDNSVAVAALPATRGRRRKQEEEDGSNSDSSSSVAAARRKRRRRRPTQGQGGGTKTTGLSNNNNSNNNKSRSTSQSRSRSRNRRALTAAGTQGDPCVLSDGDDQSNGRKTRRLTTPQRTAKATQADPIVLLESSDSELEAMTQEAIIASMKDKSGARKSTGSFSASSFRTRSSGRSTNNSQRRKTISELPAPTRKRTPPKPPKTPNQLDSKPAAKPSTKPAIDNPSSARKRPPTRANSYEGASSGTRSNLREDAASSRTASTLNVNSVSQPSQQQKKRPQQELNTPTDDCYSTINNPQASNRKSGQSIPMDKNAPNQPMQNASTVTTRAARRLAKGPAVPEHVKNNQTASDPSPDQAKVPSTNAPTKTARVTRSSSVSEAEPRIEEKVELSKPNSQTTTSHRSRTPGRASSNDVTVEIATRGRTTRATTRAMAHSGEDGVKQATASSENREQQQNNHATNDTLNLSKPNGQNTTVPEIPNTAAGRTHHNDVGNVKQSRHTSEAHVLSQQTDKSTTTCARRTTASITGDVSSSTSRRTTRAVTRAASDKKERVKQETPERRTHCARSAATDQGAPCSVQGRVMKLEGIKQDPGGARPLSQRKGKRKYSAMSKDLGRFVQVERGISAYEARIVLDETGKEIISDAGAVLVQWTINRERELVWKQDIRFDLAVDLDSDNSISTTATRRSSRLRTKPKKLGAVREQSIMEVEIECATRTSMAKSLRSCAKRCKSEDDEASVASCKGKQTQSRIFQRQPESEQHADGDLKPAAKPRARNRDDTVRESYDADKENNFKKPSLNLRREELQEAPSYTATNRTSKRKQWPLKPRPTLKEIRCKKLQPKAKHTRPSKPEMGSIVWLVDDHQVHNPTITADELYSRREAVVVGESIFKFMSQHERLLQLQDDTGHRWYVKESEVMTPRLVDGHE